MMDILKWKESENLYKKHFDRFMRLVACQAKKLQTEQKAVTLHVKDMSKEGISNTRRVAHHFKKLFPRTGKTVSPPEHNKRKAHKDAPGTKQKRDVTEAPLCLNPVFRTEGRRRHINQCNMSDDNTKNTL